MSSSSRVNLEKYLIPLDEIIRATKNFSQERCIGGGGFGSVYKGQLSSRWQNLTVAVKRLDADSHQGGREFRNEIELISRFHHENIIAFIGYCDEGVEMIIVYEYAWNGSLDHHLQDPKKMSCITWVQRLNICIGAARGLLYLHSGLGEEDRVIHRDVKSANILLDGNMVAKICDFGLSKLGTTNQKDNQHYTKVAGTPFYLDPSYRESGILQKESDVYSFGVVLFEVASGMLVYHERSIGDERRSLMNTVRRYHHNDTEKLKDPCIRDQIGCTSFSDFKKVAYQCISLKLTERPTLETVIKKLDSSIYLQFIGGSMKRSIIGKLNSASPYDQQIAAGEIRLLTTYSDYIHSDFRRTGAIPLLRNLLMSPDSQTQEHAVAALFNLSKYEGNRGIIISSGAIPDIVHILKKGNDVARQNAADTILELSKIDGAEGTIGSAGTIPPLVLLLREGTTTVKMNAIDSLNNLCINDIDNCGRAVAAGLVPVLMKLLTESQGELKDSTVELLASLSEHPEGKLAIGETEVVPHLVDFIGTGSRDYEEEAIAVLVNLCSLDLKYLVEAQNHGVMEKLEDLREDGTDEGKRKARELRRMIKDHHKVDYGSDEDSRLRAKAKRGARKISKICHKISNIHL